MTKQHSKHSDPTTSRAPLDAELLTSLLSAPAGPVARLEIRASAGSTNSELAAAVAADPAEWPAPALFVAEHQVAGRGRTGRTWQTPARAALTASVLLRPQVPRARLSWLPLLAGLATVSALRSAANVPAIVKWPNDVLVPTDGPAIEGWGTARKLCGILVDLLPDGGVIVGLGLNTTQTAQELPVPTATSLALVGAATTDRTVLLAALAKSYRAVLGRWIAADGDVHAAGLVAEIAAVSATLGSQVRVERTDGTVFYGLATGLAADGGLLVETPDSDLVTVRSGDVHHLRLD